MRNILAIIFILFTLFQSCSNKKELSDENQNKTVSTEKTEDQEELLIQDSPIINKYWKLTEILGKPVNFEEGMKREVFIKLNAKGELSGHGGCNSFFGNFTLDRKNFINFQNLAMTEMACEFENYDDKLYDVLGMARQYIINGEDNMQLIVGKRAPLAKFEAVYFD